MDDYPHKQIRLRISRALDSDVLCLLVRCVLAALGAIAVWLMIGCVTLPAAAPASPAPATGPQSGLTLTGAHKGFTVSVTYQF
jgi:hypothetical protein